MCRANSNNHQFLVKPPKQGFLKKLFRSSSLSRKALPPVRYRTMDSICGICHFNESEKRAKPQYQPPYDFAEARAQKVSRASRAVKAGRGQFLCTKCTSEGRPITHASQRVANNGLCCDNGRIEFEKHWKLARSGHSPLLTGRRPLPAAPAALARANSEPVHFSPRSVLVAAREAVNLASQGYGRSRVEAVPVGLLNPGEKKGVKGVGFDPERHEQARLVRQYTSQKLSELSPVDGLPEPPTTRREKKEKQAVGFEPERGRSQVWNRDPIHLEPKRGHDFSNLPGYVLPEQKTDQDTYYLESQIELDRWGDHLQTNHGRIPIAPQRALPQTPQKDKDKPLPSLPQTPQIPSNSRSAPHAPRKSRKPVGSQPSSSKLETPTRERSRPLHGAYQTQAETGQPPGHSLSMPKVPTNSHEPLSSQSSSSKLQPLARERPKERINQTQAERLHRVPPREQVHVPPIPLRSMHRTGWYGKEGIEEVHSQHPDTCSHRLTSPFDQPYARDAEEQDIASVSRFTQAYSPVSPMNASRFPDETAPLSLRKKPASFRKPAPEQTKRESSQDVMEKAFREAYGAAVYWEQDLRGEPRPKK